jgi:hypothetical protein
MVRDRRVLRGGIPDRPGLGIVNTDAYTPLREVFHRINAFARWGRLKAVFILAHGKAGFDAHPRTDGLQSYEGPGGVCKDAGGMGVSLGAEGIRHGNVGLWTAVRGHIENIVLYSCAAADTQPGNEGTLADGRYLMGALAIHSGAQVYASNSIQWFHTYRNLAHGRFIHAEWSGDLLAFSPSDGRGRPVRRKSLAFDFSTVMARTR